LDRKTQARPTIKSISNIQGTIHGRIVELDQEPGLPDGQSVSVTLVAALPSNGNLRRCFGSWADDAAELDPFLEQIRGDRKRQRESFTP
jgi:hypothetical protein